MRSADRFDEPTLSKGWHRMGLHRAGRDDKRSAAGCLDSGGEGTNALEKTDRVSEPQVKFALYVLPMKDRSPLHLGEAPKRFLVFFVRDRLGFDLHEDHVQDVLRLLVGQFFDNAPELNFCRYHGLHYTAGFSAVVFAKRLPGASAMVRHSLASWGHESYDGLSARARRGAGVVEQARLESV